MQCWSLQLLGGVLLWGSPSIHVHLALLRLELILHHHLLLLLSRVLMLHGIVRGTAHAIVHEAPGRIMQGAARVLPRHIGVLHRRRARAWAAAVRGPTSPLRWWRA